MGDVTYASNLFMAALSYIDDVLDNCMFNANGEEYESPFSDTGNSFKCDAFEVRAYDWDWDAREDNSPQPFNFKWRDIEVTWPKYVGRGPKTNRKVSPDEISEMVDECVEAICKYSAKRHANEKASRERNKSLVLKGVLNEQTECEADHHEHRGCALYCERHENDEAYSNQSTA